MARKATMIITPSELVKNEVCDSLKIESGRVVAVPLAPGPGFSPLPLPEASETLRRLSVEDNFLLFVGTIQPRKNLLRLIQAFEVVLRTTQLRPQLVLVGRTGWKTNELMSYLPKSEALNRIRILGYLSDEDLRALYSSCRAFIYPSIYEGFGLPPLEAMACGAPVIASGVPSVMGSKGTVARIVSSEDIESLAAAIVELLTDDDARAELSESGFRHASSFSWERTAAVTREVYEEALRRGS
jgi:glycosyltransferase involved in cell wall biosynthesis